MTASQPASQPTPNSPWKLDGEDATFRCGPLTGKLGPCSDGLSQMAFDGVPITGRLWRAKPGPEATRLAPAIERYSRGPDLVAIHAPAQGFPFRTQLAWTIEPSVATPDVVLVTLTLSLQTDLLDTRPWMSLQTDLPGYDLRDLPEGASERWIGQTDAGAENAWACFEMVHPLDQVEAELRGGSQPSIKIEPPFLEKGVIRRCRVAAAFFAGKPSPDRLDLIRDAFHGAELPLTA